MGICAILLTSWFLFAAVKVEATASYETTEYPYGEEAVSAEQCCQKKTVGMYDYTLIGEGDVPAHCLSRCLYSRDDEDKPKSKYCFAKGRLEVNCTEPTKALFPPCSSCILIYCPICQPFCIVDPWSPLCQSCLREHCVVCILPCQGPDGAGAGEFVASASTIIIENEIPNLTIDLVEVTLTGIGCASTNLTSIGSNSTKSTPLPSNCKIGKVTATLEATKPKIVCDWQIPVPSTNRLTIISSTSTSTSTSTNGTIFTIKELSSTTCQIVQVGYEPTVSVTNDLLSGTINGSVEFNPAANCPNLDFETVEVLKTSINPITPGCTVANVNVMVVGTDAICTFINENPSAFKFDVQTKGSGCVVSIIN